MKSKFLDLKNCNELLPSHNRIKFIQRLEVCLDEINNKGPLKGLVDALIKSNERTINKFNGSKRLSRSPIEIAQTYINDKKIINTQVLEKRFPGPAYLHTDLGYENGMEHKTTIPLQFLLKGWGNAANGYQGYIHTISHDVIGINDPNELFLRNISDSGNYYYVGITGRNWLKRLDEHIREMEKGNRRRFYLAWREHYGMTNVLFSSFLREVNLSYDDVMNWEENRVDKIASDQYGLNMIPGGFKGLKYLHKFRLIDHTNISLDEREKAIANYALKNPRKGLPNPFISELWKDDEHYSKVMNARPKTLSRNQVLKIRELDKKGWPITSIAKEVDAINELQVQNVLSGKYYTRY